MFWEEQGFQSCVGVFLEACRLCGYADVQSHCKPRPSIAQGPHLQADTLLDDGDVLQPGSVIYLGDETTCWSDSLTRRTGRIRTTMQVGTRLSEMKQLVSPGDWRREL